jgi:hypothetical protein
MSRIVLELQRYFIEIATSVFGVIVMAHHLVCTISQGSVYSMSNDLELSRKSCRRFVGKS